MLTVYSRLLSVRDYSDTHPPTSFSYSLRNYKSCTYYEIIHLGRIELALEPLNAGADMLNPVANVSRPNAHWQTQPWHFGISSIVTPFGSALIRQSQKVTTCFSAVSWGVEITGCGADW